MASTLFTRWTLGAALAVLAAPASSTALAAGRDAAASGTATPVARATSSSRADGDATQTRVRERERERAREVEREREQQQDRERRGRDEGQEDERITKSFKVGSSGSLLLTNISGDIRVTGGSGSEIVIEAIKHARSGRNGDGATQLRNLDVSIQESGGRVEVRTYHRGKNDRSWVDYVVTVPSGARVDLQSVSGGVQVKAVQGETRAESVSGDVVGAGLGRVTQLKSVSGNVELTNSQSDSELTVSSISGDVRAASLKARSVVLTTVSGEAIVKGCECNRAMLKSVSGNLEYAGAIMSGGRYEANAHSGDIRFTPSGSAGYELEASTFSGDIHTEPPLKVTSSSRGRGPGQSLRGTAGNGGAFLDLTTFSGDIFVGSASGGGR